jgi:hypothetical protein
MAPGVKGDESRVVHAFRAWLEERSWKVALEVDFCDLVAHKGEHVLYAEAKGRTSEPGLDVDTMYGQLLRRMPLAADPNRRFAIVVPTRARSAALRVPITVRAMLRIDVYVVDDDGRVTIES